MEFPIRLDQFMKLATLVGSGGEAKLLISDGLVKVNDEVETRRGRKLYAGDRVALEGRDPVVVGK